MTKTKCGTLALVLVLSSFFGIRAYAFKIISKHGHEVRWGNVPVKYYLQEDGPKSFKSSRYDGTGDKISLEEIIRRSFESWKNTSDAKIDYSYGGMISDREGGDDGKNELIFIQNDWEDLEFKPSAGALAVTISTYDTGSGKMVDSDIYFNDDGFKWGYIDTEREADSGEVVDIQNIATHEIGHFFGLDHSSESPYEMNEDLVLATMYYSSYAGEISRRALKSDDENAIRHLYPSSDSKKEIFRPAVHSIYPDYGFNMGDDLTVTIQGGNFGSLTMIKLTGNDMAEDEVCTIVSLSDDSVECVFDLYYVPRGKYNLVVSNSYEKSGALEDAFSVYGKELDEYKSQGGCGRIDESANFKSILSMFGLIILIFPITLWYFRRRAFLRTVPVKKSLR